MAKGPRIESERGSISTYEEQEIYRYFGLDGVTSTDDGATVPTAGTSDAAAHATADPGGGAVRLLPPEGHPSAGASSRPAPLPPPGPPPAFRGHDIWPPPH
ncbi:MAG: hypothetical protein M3017_17095 [Actinomycetota bacterium]|nr:hypothetical protein [Actinomycetota bacterium]